MTAVNFSAFLPGVVAAARAIGSSEREATRGL
jgi:hypothetical protein